jgi:hypothetical protein
MKLAFVTVSAGEEFARLASLVNPAKRRHCDRFGYDFVAFDEVLDTSRHPSWSKIIAIRRVLPQYDWVFWCDTDAVLWNGKYGLRQFVTAASEDAVFQVNHEGINAGLFFIRNSSWSFSFLDDVYRQEQFVDHPWWEQATIIELLQTEDVHSHVKIYAQQEPRGGFHGYRTYDDWDKIIIHYAGMPRTLLPSLIENLVRLAEMQAPLRMLERAEFGHLLNRLGLLGDGVEVGVAAGEFSKTILDVWEGRRLHLIDPWQHLANYVDLTNVSDAAHEELFRSLPQRLASHCDRYCIHRMLSQQAVESFDDRSLDFVYIDAEHTYEAVQNDVALWYPKVRAGGILAGHDFVDGNLPEGQFGVRKAVLEFEQHKHLRVAVTAENEWPSWYVIKPA